MTTLRLIFVQNQPIFEFIYGLSFFVMGLAIALQSRRSTRLELARSLAWLAAFGVTHSLYVWGEFFSPVQEAYLSTSGIETLHVFHLLMLSISFGCLLEFGVVLLRPLRRGQWLRWITLGWLAAYAIFALLILPNILGDMVLWHHIAEALARYTIGLPGGLVAAYALREQTYRHISPLEAPHIVTMLRTAGITLAVYAIFGGLFPPPVPFFPGNVLNTDTFEEVVGIPLLVLLSLIGLILVITIIRALEIFDMETERRIEDMEQQQILLAERERIARELHDNTIQAAYTAGLLIDSARKLSEPESQIAGRLDKAVLALNEVIAALRRLADDPRFRSFVDISLDMNLPDTDLLSPQDTDHVLSIVHEALSNVVRHAGARQVKITARQSEDTLCLTIQDDGSGLMEERQNGYGLRNMDERARLLGGKLQVQSENTKGTRVTLEIPHHSAPLQERGDTLQHGN
jgi:signal transduction histidine kinase